MESRKGSEDPCSDGRGGSETKSGPRHVIEFAIHEKDFLMAGESASKTKKALQQLGLKAEVVKNAAIVVYEAAMNVVIHANHGNLKIVIVPEEVLILAEDVGPGIPDHRACDAGRVFDGLSRDT